jgi:hypothetical protein
MTCPRPELLVDSSGTQQEYFQVCQKLIFGKAQKRSSAPRESTARYLRSIQEQVQEQLVCTLLCAKQTRCKSQTPELYCFLTVKSD